MTHNLLKGKRGIIFGALNEDSIAWKVAKKAAEEGAQITLSNTPMALRMGTLDKLAEEIGATIIPADATNVDDLTNVFQKSMEVLGGKIDFVLHSIGMSPNVRKHRTYDDLDYGYLQKTLDISAISFHKMLQSAKKLDAIAEYGSRDCPHLRSLAAHILRLQRHGRCQEHARKHCTLIWLHLWPRKARAYQHHLTKPHRHNRWQGHQGD